MDNYTDIPSLFGCKVFNDATMRERLPKEVYEAIHAAIAEGRELDKTVANEVAAAMKDWAIENGATHFTHWFQPMTGVTAEKHDSFISPQADGGVIMEFSGKELRRGEPDASCFPSGGLRATFEARGYTAWDPTSYAFLKDDSLCIPTAFCSYGGEMLDKKTPLLRTMEVINTQALRVLRLFGSDAGRVIPQVGAEQEYFLIDKALADERKDLKFTGRTLFGAKPPKRQELEDHYFGAIRPRVMDFMRELNLELWKLGVYAKTEHNEAAPAQHELAPVYASANTATDHNQLTMEIMKKLAEKHGLTCLLHEKPFAGVNGSGKHNNWSLSTDTGVNLFNPGKKPYENKQFLLFVAAVIKAVDMHQDLLRVTSASAGNDLRLGATEAPPAIISIYIGAELTAIFDAIESGVPYEPEKAERMKTGVNVIPDFRKDTIDRNRTSPVAFTGNKFEFRMPGSSFSISGPNIVINTIVADVLSGFADRLESAADFDSEVEAILRDTYAAHKRIVFNGNNYSDEWVEEAKKRGLLDLPTTADALPYFVSPKNVELFTKHGIFTEKEILSRREILTENYCSVNLIEAFTMLDMAKKDILPAALEFEGRLSEGMLARKNALGRDVSGDADAKLTGRINALAGEFYSQTEALDATAERVRAEEDFAKRADLCRDELIPAMNALRGTADELEMLVDGSYWPFPTYGELLYSV
ncbi:MAG: glutamine synthetase III [Clostridia bacterium]|nr:glutamine synthetase III [Clostridia bacterium]